MTTEQRKEDKTNNELIAEFMGYKKTDRVGIDNAIWWSFGDSSGLWDSQFCYDTSWSRLMPVVNRIEELVSKRPEVGNLLSGWTHYFNLFNGTIYTDIKTSYEVVVEFIKFVNSQAEYKR